MLNRFKKFLEDAAEEGEKLFARVKDRAQFQRVVCASFLIAIADGDFDSDEKSALANIIAQKLPQFSISDILKVLSNCEDLLAFDKTMGIMELQDDIGKASGDDAEMIIRIACFIGASDGDFDDDEKKVASDIAKAMGIDASRYGL